MYTNLYTPIYIFNRILLVYYCKCCNLIGCDIEQNQPLVRSGWKSSRNWRRFSRFSKYWGNILMQMNN